MPRVVERSLVFSLLVAGCAQVGVAPSSTYQTNLRNVIRVTAATTAAARAILVLYPGDHACTWERFRSRTGVTLPVVASTTNKECFPT